MTTSLASAQRLAFATDLARHGGRTALIEVTSGGTRTITYNEVAARVADQSARLGAERLLVAITLDRTIDAVATYLAVLAGGHVALLVAEGDGDSSRPLVTSYSPDVVAARVDGEWQVAKTRPRSAHGLHPDLAALLTTSGSTGSPKLVRLSAHNLQSNADAITEALGIHPDDRAVTTLPLSYSYGLSVLHSHLNVGASLLLTDRSVVDAALWDAMAAHDVTTLPAVPYTFDLLDRVGFERQQLPSLRSVTVAGGRLAPERVEHYAELGRAKGFRLHVMYGQTEATARIATLDPDLAARHPDAIGTPLPGGAIELDPIDPGTPETGEIVYRGPNTMLGYADTPADLARGAEIEALRTGDLATRGPDGLLRVVGRRSRFAKVFGLRVDLDHAEQSLAADQVSACVVSDDTGLCVVAEGRVDPEHLADRVARATGLPLHVIHVRVVDSLPRLATGKLDRTTASNCCSQIVRQLPERTEAVTAESLTALFATLLGRPDATEDDSFVSLGGDSLSFVEVSVRLEALLGTLPPDWHLQSPRELAAAGHDQPQRRWTAQLDTSVPLRAAAIVAIVGTHIGLFDLLGGAHVLLGLAGYSVARFLLDPGDLAPRAPKVLRSAARVAVPSALWIALVALLTADYTWRNAVLLGTHLGPEQWGPSWHFWFIEALLLYLLATAALVAIPAFNRIERAHPFVVSGILVAVGLVMRYGLMPGLEDPRPSPAPAVYYFWFFAIGWWAARAATRWQRLLVSAVVVLALPGYWDDPLREGAVAAGILVLLWLPTLRVPRTTVPLLTRLAAASLAIYLTHWTVFPLLEATPLVALVASLGVGVVVYELARAAVKAAKSRSFWSAYARAYSARARSTRSLLPR